MRPELFAIRASAQYRRRDVLAYLGLRYYLDNDCAKRDIWARDVSTHLVKTRESPIYHRSYHFKEVTSEDVVVHRNIYLPGPNEIIAEAALLQSCSAEKSFRSLECVYSYNFPDASSREGVFRSYFPGFQSRKNSIVEACQKLDSTDKVVRYTDIRKFYPTIPHDLAFQTWVAACESSDIPHGFRELGEILLAQHNETAKIYSEGIGILTGPMFSHLIANLVLAEVDKQMYRFMDGSYWRYVDDFVLVGSSRKVDSGRKELHNILDGMGFSLHDEGKDFEISSRNWLEETCALDQTNSKVWAALIANVKRFLVVNPDKRESLREAFFRVGINIPLLDYSSTVEESTYLESLSDWLSRYTWAPGSVRSLTIDKLVECGLGARRTYAKEIAAVLDEDANVDGYKRKQIVSRLRFYAKRLSYLETLDNLHSLSIALSEYPELYLESVIMRTIYSHDVSLLLKIGSNAVQAASQILRIQRQAVNCSTRSFSEVELQGLAILRINGVEINFLEGVESQTLEDPLNQFALRTKPAELMKSDDLFVKEISCLRGIETASTHEDILDTAFDRNEQLSFDIIDQLQASSYF